MLTNADTASINHNRKELDIYIKIHRQTDDSKVIYSRLRYLPDSLHEKEQPNQNKRNLS
jgi:hypothetical protein